MKKWLKRTVFALAGLIVLVPALIFIVSEWSLGRKYEPVPRSIELATEPHDLAEGERLARVLGCYRGCHGRHMEGNPELFAAPDGSIIRSANLTRWARDYTPSQLEAVVRQGIRPNGRTVDAMPSASFAVLSDQHLSQILGFISSYEYQDHDPGTSRLMPLVRLFLLTGKFKTGVDAMVEGRGPTLHGALENPETLGRYLALAVCSECHGMDLGGDGSFTPALAIVRGYDRDSFRRLMREGIAIGERELALMSDISRSRLTHLKDKEIDALWEYLASVPIPLND